MSVIGIDFGNHSCYITVAKYGGIETIVTDELSERRTLSYVAFSQRKRILGVSAKNQMLTNLENTVFGFKKLLGKQFSDPIVEEELKHLPFKVEAKENGCIGIRVSFLGEENVYSPEQITAMLFVKLKDIASKTLETTIDYCVISVPSYFTNAERTALLDIAEIAGLKVLRLFNETTATALAYGMFKDDFPAPEDNSRNVVIVDFGHSSLQVAACAFNEGKLRVLATSTDHQCGGRDIDKALADHFWQEFSTLRKLHACNDKKAFFRLLEEAEKQKIQMSTTCTSLEFKVEPFMNGLDFSSKIQRSEMETICSMIFVRVETTLRDVLRKAKLSSNDIHSIEIVGGSTRIPAVKALIEKVFHKQASTTLNQDEAVSRGCALQCAVLSQGGRARSFEVIDVQPYTVSFGWDSPDGYKELPALCPAPFSEIITFIRHNSFVISAFYSHEVPSSVYIGSWHILNVDKTSVGVKKLVKLKAGVNIHGIITIKEYCDQEETADNNEKESQDKKHWLIIPPEPWLTSGEVKRCIEVEDKMQAADRQEMERAAARNELDEFVSETRNDTQAARDADLMRALDITSKWLKEHGEHKDRKVYKDKLNELKYTLHISAVNEFLYTHQIEHTVPKKRPAPRGFNHEPTKRNFNVNEPSTSAINEFDVFNNPQPSTSRENYTAPEENTRNPPNDRREKDEEYYAQVKELNIAVMNWMTKQMAENPHYCFSEIFKQYEAYLIKISENIN